MVVSKKSLENLQPFEPGSERHLELSAKGGSATGESKSLARKLDWLKRKGMDDEQSQALHDMLTNEDVSDLTILAYIETLKKMAEADDGDFNKIRATIELLLKWRKERFGNKVKVEGNITIDWSSDIDRILDACKTVDVEVKDD